jgi:hypothetical protein
VIPVRPARATARIALGAALSLAVACATARPPAPQPLPPGDPRAAAFLAALAERATARQSLRGVAHVALDGPNGSGRAKQILALARPARLRVEVLGLFDQTIALLVTDGAHYRLVRDRHVERGAVYPALLEDVAGLAVTPEEAVDVLLATPQAEAPARIESAALLAGGGLRLVRRIASSAREELEFDAAANLVRWQRTGPDGELLLEARFADYRPTAVGDPYPREIELDDVATGARARIEWSEVELDPTLPPHVFDLPAAGALP